MNNLDILIKEKFVPFRNRLVDAAANKHPYLVSMVNTMLSGNDNMVGMRVTDESGRVEGEYTFKLNGARISGVESGVLKSEIHHPFFGTLKPYVTVKESVLEKMLEDEESFAGDPFGTIKKYLPGLEIKFMN
ncbi:MAG: hypothetical protein ACOY30_04750 [Bacillota bacterium]